MIANALTPGERPETPQERPTGLPEEPIGEKTQSESEKSKEFVRFEEAARSVFGLTQDQVERVKKAVPTPFKKKQKRKR